MPPPLVVMILFPLSGNTQVGDRASGTSSIRGPERFSRVLDHGDSQVVAHRDDLVVVRALTEEINHDDRCR